MSEKIEKIEKVEKMDKVDKKEQLLIITPANELKFRGKSDRIAMSDLFHSGMDGGIDYVMTKLWRNCGDDNWSSVVLTMPSVYALHIRIRLTAV